MDIHTWTTWAHCIIQSLLKGGDQFLQFQRKVVTCSTSFSNLCETVCETVARNSKLQSENAIFRLLDVRDLLGDMQALRPARRWGTRRRGGSARRQRSHAVARPTGARRQPSSLLSGATRGAGPGADPWSVFLSNAGRVCLTVTNICRKERTRVRARRAWLSVCRVVAR